MNSEKMNISIQKIESLDGRRTWVTYEVIDSPTTEILEQSVQIFDYASLAGDQDTYLQELITAFRAEKLAYWGSVDIPAFLEERRREAVRATFNYKRFKITIDSYNYASEKLPALLNYVSGKIHTMLPQYGELQPDGDQSVTLFVTEIHPVHRAAMEQHTAVIHITENPYYIA